MSRRHFPRLALALFVGMAACKKDEPSSTSTATAPAGNDKAPAPAPPGSSATPTPSTPTPTPTGAPAQGGGGPVDSPAVTDLGEVVATVQIPSGTAVADVAALVDNFQPGASLMVSTQAGKALGEMIGTSLEGAKLDAPIAVVVVDPSKHPKPAALLVTVADAAKLGENAKAAGLELRTRDALALLGPADVVATAESFAFTNLAKQPDHTEVIVYPKPLITAFQPQIDAGLATLAGIAPPGMGPGMGMIAGMYGGLIKGMAEQVTRVVVSVRAAPGVSEVYLRFYPSPGSTFAAFVGSQRPTDHGLLSRLRATAVSNLVAAGRLEAGAANEAVLNWASEAMAPFFSNLDAATLRKMLEVFSTTVDGEVAMLGALDPSKPAAAMRMTMAYGVNDAEAARTVWRDMMKMMAGLSPLETMGMKATISFREREFEHDGIPVDRYSTTIDASAMPAATAAAMQAAGQQEYAIATFDKLTIVTADSAAEEVGKTIDAARGKGDAFAPSPEISAALAASKARGDSLLYYIGLAGMMPVPVPVSGITMGMGKQGEALSLCIAAQK